MLQRGFAGRAEPQVKTLTLDAVAVPGLLLLVAADLLIRRPSRALAWRLLHGLGPSGPPAWLASALPTGAVFDSDPLALLLSGAAVGLATTYLFAAMLGASARMRGWIVAGSVLAMVVFPTFLYISVGAVTGRPFGQDGGVVQLPLAMDLLLSGESPYGADYSDSVLGKESRASAFWRTYGENPILRHHAYLPGTHLLTLPFYLAADGLVGGFDARIVSTLALLLAILMASRLFVDSSHRLAAAALVGLNPLVYWHQAFGANDMVFVALLLGSALAGERRRLGFAGALLGLACATKQLAWPFVPFLLVHWASVASIRELAVREAWARLKRPIAAGLLVFAGVVAPVALLDLRAFWADIVSYNAGLGADAYPLGGTPGFGVGNLVIYFGGVASLRDPFPFYLFYLLLVPLGLVMIRAQIRRGGLGAALAGGSVCLLATIYFSRVAHPNYLIAAAILLPIGVMLEDASADAALSPLAMVGLATTVAGSGMFQSVWDSARAADLQSRGPAFVAALWPRAPSSLTSDPIGLGLGALAGGLAVTYAIVAMAGAKPRVRSALLLLAIALVVVVPTALVTWVGSRTGVVLAAGDWVVQTNADVASLARGESPYASTSSQAARGSEAWSTSFSQKPAQALAPRQASFPPGASLLALAVSPVGFWDSRIVLVLSLLALLLTCVVSVTPANRPLALALGLLPPVALGIIFGADEAPWLAATLLALVASRNRNMIVSGLLVGAAAAIDTRALVVLTFASLFRAGWQRGSQTGGFVLAAVFSYAALVGPVAFLQPRAIVSAAQRIGDLAPGAGIVNVAAYQGLEASVRLHELLALGPWIAGALSLWLLILVRPSSAVLVATFWLMMMLLLAREATGFALASPLILLVVSATARAPDLRRGAAR